MLIIERLPDTLPPDALTRRRDTLTMTSEERRWARRRVTTTAGREVVLALPTGTVLLPGMIVAVGPDWYLEVEAAPEAVLAVRPPDFAAAVRLAFEVGNHHFTLALADEELMVPDDPAMVQLLDRLGLPWERRRVLFNPLARGHYHER
jgi:urease accessory protein